MRGWLALALTLGALCAPGCFTSGTSALKWLPHSQGFIGLHGPDVIRLQVAVLEVPVGDPKINEQVWQLADERIGNKGEMDANGFRVAQVGGQPPAELQELLTSKRFCLNARGREFRANENIAMSLGPPRDVWRFSTRIDGEPVNVELAQAEPKLGIIASLPKDGRVTLRFTPQLLPQGKPTQSWQAAGRVLEWQEIHQRPAEEYPHLGWEVTLAPNEYLLLGGRYDRPGTLGHESFVRTDEAKPVQRLLVIRLGPLEKSQEITTRPDPDDDESAELTIAAQAGGTSARPAQPR
jgi:hypothetical protein